MADLVYSIGEGHLGVIEKMGAVQRDFWDHTLKPVRNAHFVASCSLMQILHSILWKQRLNSNKTLD